MSTRVSQGVSPGGSKNLHTETGCCSPIHKELPSRCETPWVFWVSHPVSPQELIRKGIPHHFRAIVWQLLCSATDMPVKNQYSELLKMSSPCEKLIRRDIARTYPEHEFFKGQDSLGQEVLFNVMKVTSRSQTSTRRGRKPTRRFGFFH